ncbi:MAG: AmmeMemoRadiSam system radical SAM enzyme [Methanomassiliicoccales archaeon]|nr:MAG: AmmeMemoRadiSam system radical SAM enzyme [Methanomassiliicoccales archaeon]
MKESMFWQKLEDDKVECLLCPHRCKISPGKLGVCGVRENRKGKLNTLIYGLATSVTPDPIEKKPLFHFHPGTYVLSFGTVGCNLKCIHCQNYSISQAKIEGMRMKNLKKEDIVTIAQRYKCEGIAWTYNEPTIWYEFTYDASKIAKEKGLYTCYVTNGFIEKEPLEKISPYLDAMNIDVKSFHNDFYKKTCKGKLQPVLDTCELAKELGIFIELTYLIIPGLNDSESEIANYCKWIAESLGENTPIHFSRFHPDYKMQDTIATPMSTLTRAHEIAKEAGIKYVYLGNVPHGDYENTYCPECGELLIERIGFSTRAHYVKNGKCPKCELATPLIQ